MTGQLMKEDAMAYPPGMTLRDWKHIGGEQHYRHCPAAEYAPEGLHLCNGRWKEGYTVEWSSSRNRWQLVVPHLPYVVTAPIEYCPFCGEELLAVRCICEDIAQDLKEEAMERKDAEKE